MHCWSLRELIDDLRANNISHKDALLYLLGFVIFNTLGLSAFSWLFDLYHVTMRVVKEYLEHKAQGSQLFISIYDTYDTEFSLALIALITLGIIACWKANRDRQHFIKRFICLSWVINIRIVLWLTLMYVMGIIMAISMYLPHLVGLAPTPFNPQNPLELVVELAKNIGTLKPIMDKVSLLQRATQVFKGINMLSQYAYNGVLLASLMATLWYFIRMRQSFKRIQQNGPGGSILE